MLYGKALLQMKFINNERWMLCSALLGLYVADVAGSVRGDAHHIYKQNSCKALLRWMLLKTFQ